MADRGFTALKFDLDLPLLPHEDLYARTISAAQLERQVALAEATVAGGRGSSGGGVRPALALRAGGCAPARARPRAPAGALARRPDSSAGPRVGRADLGADDDPDLHRREPLPAGRLRSADRPGRRRHPRARHPEGRRAQRHAPDRGVRRRPLAAARPAQHRRADRHARLGARLRLDPELPGARVARGVGAVLRRARDARPTGDRRRVRRAARRSGDRRRARPRRVPALRDDRASRSSASRVA